MVGVVGERFNDAAAAPREARAPYTVKDITDSIFRKDMELLRTILASKEVADLNASEGEGMTPLNRAVCDMNAEALALLLDAGADVNAKSRSYPRETPLIYAVQHYWVSNDIVKLLLERGAKPDGGCDDHEKIPLLLAARNGNETVLELLLEHDADINIADGNGKNAAAYAAEAGHAGILHLLAQNGVQLDKRYANDENTPLLESITHRRREAFDTLLHYGVPTGAQHKDGHTALMYAAWAGETGMVDALLAKGVGAETQNKDGYNALMWAVDSGKRLAVKKLLDYGVSLDARTNKGQSALDIAREKGHEEIAKMLERKAFDLANDCSQKPAKPFRITLGVKNVQ